MWLEYVFSIQSQNLNLKVRPCLKNVCLKNARKYFEHKKDVYSVILKACY